MGVKQIQLNNRAFAAEHCELLSNSLNMMNFVIQNIQNSAEFFMFRMSDKLVKILLVAG